MRYFLPVYVLIVFGVPSLVGAQTSAALFFSPATGNSVTNQEMTVRVMLDTGGQPVNAVDGRIVFDPKELTVERIDRDASILSSWPTEPRYDNDVGEIVFAGSMPATTTFSGDRGEILTLLLRGVRSTETHLRFDRASAVLAGDGTGGNVLAELRSGRYVFAPKESSPPVSESGGEVLGAETVAISSPTHPDESVWYRAKDASFTWSNPPGVVRVRTALTDRPTSRGTRTFDPPIDKRDVGDVPEGISYFHVTQEFSDGTERTMHYRLQIDTTPPSVFELREDDARDPTDPTVAFVVNATDTHSGIDRITFSLDGKGASEWRDVASRKYVLSGVAFGDHRLHAVAYDRAGNTVERDLAFSVLPLSAPTFVVEGTFREGDRLRAHGTAKPDTTLRVYFSPEASEARSESVPVQSDGTFVFESQTVLRPGKYRVSADIVDARGATSDRIAEETILVSTTFRGTLSRHPMLFVAIFAAFLGFISLAFALRWFMRRRRFEKEKIAFASGIAPARVGKVAPASLEMDAKRHVALQKNGEDRDGATKGVNEHARDTHHHRPIIDRGVIDLRPTATK
jgi:hypothetical protein